MRLPLSRQRSYFIAHWRRSNLSSLSLFLLIGHERMPISTLPHHAFHQLRRPYTRFRRRSPAAAEAATSSAIARIFDARTP